MSYSIAKWTTYRVKGRDADKRMTVSVKVIAPDRATAIAAVSAEYGATSTIAQWDAHAIQGTGNINIAIASDTPNPSLLHSARLGDSCESRGMCFCGQKEV